MQLVNFLFFSCLCCNLLSVGHADSQCDDLCDGQLGGSQVSGDCCTEDFCLCGEDGGVLLGCHLPGYLFCSSLQACVDQNSCTSDNCCSTTTTADTTTGTTISTTDSVPTSSSTTSSVSGCSDNIAFSSGNSFPDAKIACYDENLLEV